MSNPIPTQVPPIPSAVSGDPDLGWLVKAWPALMSTGHAARDLVETRTRLIIAEVRLAARELLDRADELEAEADEPDYLLESIRERAGDLVNVVAEAATVVGAVMAGREEVYAG